MGTAETALTARNLRIWYDSERGSVHAVDGVSLDLFKGQTLGLVGESGCGKSTLARGLLGFVPPGGAADGEIKVSDQSLLAMSDKELRSVRGAKLGLIFQEPMTRLNPLMRISEHFRETIQAHEPKARDEECRRRGLDALAQMGIPQTRYTNYPHEFSGGMRQRIMIALALALSPAVVIADEPTTALDVLVEAQILEILADLRRSSDSALLLVTHSLGIIAQACDAVAVMYAGKIVERGQVSDVLTKPRHPYTQMLLESTISLGKTSLGHIPGSPPDLVHPPAGCRFHPRCPYAMQICQEQAPPPTTADGDEVACWLYHSLDAAPEPTAAQPALTGELKVGDGQVTMPSPTTLSTSEISPDDDDVVVEVRDLAVHFSVGASLASRLTGRNQSNVRAVDGVSFRLRRGEVLGVVGESGSGKTTLGRALVQLVTPTAGSVLFDGIDLASLSPGEMRRMRRRIQIMFQDPGASLNPAMDIQTAIGQPLQIHGESDGPARRQLVEEWMTRVGLTPVEQFATKYPADLSGGQKQRAVLARALILNPQLVVADEPVSMLDMSVRAKILELMIQLKQELSLTFLYITHDLATAKLFCDTIAIMYLGRIVEIGPAREIYENPKHPYTKALLAAVPDPDPANRRDRSALPGEVPDAQRPPLGCSFHPRCPAAFGKCGWESRDLRYLLEEHWTASATETFEAERQVVGNLDALSIASTEARLTPGKGQSSADVASLIGQLRDASTAHPFWTGVEDIDVSAAGVTLTFQEGINPALRRVGDVDVACLLYPDGNSSSSAEAARVSEEIEG